MTSGLTSPPGAGNSINGYTSLADFLLGLPNNGTGAAIEAVAGLQSQLAALDGKWGLRAGPVDGEPKLTLTYGIRYEDYPAPTAIARVLSPGS